MRMVDVSWKFETGREAEAVGKIRLPCQVIDMIKSGGVEKGDVLKVSEIAGIMAAKRVAELLPFCHPIPVDRVEVKATLVDDGVAVRAKVFGVWRTGYEMEAMMAVSVALLNVYDMCKPYTDNMVIEEVRLVSKEGGKSDWGEDLEGLKVSVVTISDSASAGTAEDVSGKELIKALEKAKAAVVGYKVIPDDVERIRETVAQFAEISDVVVTTGGTGLSPKDVTPEALSTLIVKEIKGFGEAMRIMGVKATPRALLSRTVSGVLGNGSLVVALPGSVKGALESLAIVIHLIKHALSMARGERHGHIR